MREYGSIIRERGKARDKQMKRFLYKEIESCSECPFYRITSDEMGNLDYGYCKHPKTLNAIEEAWKKTESMDQSEINKIGEGAIFIKQAKEKVQEFCPLDKDIELEVNVVGVRQGDLAILKIPPALEDSMNSIVMATCESLRELDILPSGILVVNDDKANLEMIPEDDMNRLGWFKKEETKENGQPKIHRASVKKESGGEGS